MKVALLAPLFNESVEIENLMSDLEKEDTLLPFSDISIEFCSAVSNKLLTLKQYPEIVALGYWLRKSHIVSMKKIFESGRSEFEIITPRGLTFHIAPSNVDSIFLYSWALSLLVGNLNLVRVSSETNPQIDYLLKILREILAEEKWQDIASRNLVVTYRRDVEINSFISANCDVRIIWGGDATIQNIRTLKTKPATKDITFVDKFSYSIIHSEEFLHTDDKKKKKNSNGILQ